MDAILEYTGMSNLPRIFSDDGVLASDVPYLKSKLNDLENHMNIALPQRMEDNRLHRFSKVLETNIGADDRQTASTSTRILPQCHKLRPSKAQPLNRTAPTNLYRAQKLMSLNSNIDLESLFISHKEKNMKANAKGDGEEGKEQEVDDWLGNLANFASLEHDQMLNSSRSSYHNISNQMLFWIFCLLCFLCYIGYKYYRKRRKFSFRRKIRSNVKSMNSMSSHFFANDKTLSPARKSRAGSSPSSPSMMSPPTSPRMVYVDKSGARRKRDIDTTVSEHHKRSEDTESNKTEHEIMNMPQNKSLDSASAQPYNQKYSYLSSQDSYKRIV